MTKLAITIAGYTFEVEVDVLPGDDEVIQVSVDGDKLAVSCPLPAASAEQETWYIVDNRPYEVIADPHLRWLYSRWGLHSVEIQDLEMVAPRPAIGNGRIQAPIPGIITQVLANLGDPVEAGQPLFILEAMKMENEIRSPVAGIVKSLHVSAGQKVALLEILAEIGDGGEASYKS